MKITTPILSFIEEIMIKYELENDLINNDLPLKNLLSEATELSDRFAIKLIFGEKIKEQKNAGKTLEEILPSIRLKRIIEALINKNCSPEDLSKLIKNDLGVNDLQSEKISKAIKNNIEIIKLINQPLIVNSDDEDDEREITDEEKNITTNKKSIANMLLK